MGCTFCATATMGIRGNLTSYEILEQVIHANRILAGEAMEQIAMNEQIVTNETKQKKKNLSKSLALVRNVVFMGMGEPLNNYDNVVEACRSLIDHKRWHLAQGKVTVSTVGVTPRIRDLTRDLPQVNLALSLHAPNQKMRTEIVPAAKAYKIEGLIDALDNHMMAFLKKPADGNVNEFTPEQRLKESTKKRAMIEYVMCK
jgi:sorting nexin-8